MISMILKQKQMKENGTDEEKKAWLSRDKQLDKCKQLGIKYTERKSRDKQLDKCKQLGIKYTERKSRDKQLDKCKQLGIKYTERKMQYENIQ